MIIYKIDSKGKIRFIKAYTEGADVVKISGILNGKSTENRSTSKAKNIGKANETTPEEQAKLELQSYIKGKLQKDYYETIEEAKNTEKILPTLAKPLSDNYGKIEVNNLRYKNVFVQPKLDGQRGLVHIENSNVKIQQRGGITVKTMKHIEEQLKSLDNEILDGELYVHSQDEENFQSIMSSIKKYRPGISEQVDLCVYDRVGEGSFKERYIDIFGEKELLNEEMLTQIEGLGKNIKKVYTKQVFNFDEILEMHDFFISKGFEGTIVRWGEQGYESGIRSVHLLKYKNFKDRTAEVLDIIPSEKRPKQGILVCRFNEIDTDTGEEGNMLDTFKVSLKTDIAGKEELLKNKQNYIGETAEIVFQKYTNSGLPTGGIYCKGFRNDK